MPLAVRTVSLSKRFGSRLVIDDAELEIPTGSIHGLVGDPGAGKSTVLRMLVDLVRPTRGRCEVLGFDVRRGGTRLRNRIGYQPSALAFSNPRLPARHLLETVTRLRRTPPAAVDELADRLGLELDAPLGRAPEVGRRVALLAAFAAQPEVVLLDEPMIGLDQATRTEVAELIRSAARDGRTVLMTAAAPGDVVDEADRVTVLRNGRLIRTASLDVVRAAADADEEYIHAR